MLVSSKFDLSWTLTSTAVRWAHCCKLALGYCVISLPWVHFELDASIVTRPICHNHQQWLWLEQAYRKRSGVGGGGEEQGHSYKFLKKNKPKLKGGDKLLNGLSPCILAVVSQANELMWWEQVLLLQTSPCLSMWYQPQLCTAASSFSGSWWK